MDLAIVHFLVDDSHILESLDDKLSINQHRMEVLKCMPCILSSELKLCDFLASIMISKLSWIHLLICCGVFLVLFLGIVLLCDTFPIYEVQSNSVLA